MPTPTKVVCPTPPEAPPLTLGDVNPTAIVDANGIPWVALTPKDYATLSKNLARIRGVLLHYKALSDYYADCIRKHNTQVGEIAAKPAEK